MTLPVIKWAEVFTDASYFPDIYYSMSWGGVPGGWNNPGANTQMGLQWGRGTGATQGFAIRGNSFAQFVVPVAITGMASSGSGIGIAFAYNQGGSQSNTLIEIGEIDASTAVSTLHIGIYTNGVGRIVVKRNATQIGISDGTVGNSGTGTVAYTMPIGNGGVSTPPYVHIEVVPVVHDSAGSVMIKADGILIMNLSGVDTRNGATSGTIDALSFGLGAGRTMTDLVIHDASGSVWIGDVRAAYFATVADGSYTSGTAVGVATRHAAVDEIASNGDTDYVEMDNTSLPKAISFTTASLPSNTVSVLAVIPRIIARKDDAGANTARILLVSGGTTDDGGQDYAIPNGYKLFQNKVYVLDPNGGIAWTIANANAVEVGIRRLT